MVEDFDDPQKEVREALVVLPTVEKGDEVAPTVVGERAAEEITRLAMVGEPLHIVVIESWTTIYCGVRIAIVQRT